MKRVPNMFRRKNTASELPKPPNKSEILSDLETFHIIQPIPERNRDLIDNVQQNGPSNSATSASAPSEDTVTEWWIQFEQFLSDIDELKNYQQHLQYKKNDLIELDNSITEQAKEIYEKLKNSIEEVKNVIENNEL